MSTDTPTHEPVTRELPSPNSLPAWLIASRFETLTAAAGPILIGTAIAAYAGGFRFLPFVAALVAGMLIQAGCNFANDYYDYKKGADANDDTGQLRSIEVGLVSAEGVFTAMLASFGLATLIGVYLIAVGGWPILLIGVASIAAAYTYTGGPYALAYHGQGDLFVLAFFGLVAVCGTTYVQALQVPAMAWVAGFGVGALTVCILIINNLRDFDRDKAVGKNTLVVKLGYTFGVVEYIACLGVAYAAPFILYAMGVHAFVLFPVLTLVLAKPLIGLVVRNRDPKALNDGLENTGKLHLAYSVTFALGIFAASFAV